MPLHRIRFASVLLAASCLLSFCLSARAAELTAQQKQFLTNIEQRLSEVKANLKTAQDTLGTDAKKPTTSQTKLALVRSGQARADLTVVKEAVKKLPADDAAVKSVADQCDSIEKSLDELDAKIKGDAPPAKAPAAGTKLDYKQEQALKDCLFYLREIQGAADALAGVVDQVRAAKDVDRIDHRLLASSEATIAKAKDRKKAIDDRLATLPADGTGVKEARSDTDAAMARVDSAAANLGPIQERVKKLIDPATHPTLDADVKRLQGLGQMFSDPGILVGDRKHAATICLQRKAAHEELDRIAQAYDALVSQQTPDGKKVEGVAKFLAENLAKFDAAANATASALPGEIESDIAAVLKMTDDAVASEKTAFFTGGIPQSVSNLGAKIELLAALDPRAGETATASLQSAKRQIVEKQRSLREKIIDQNDLPPDRYTAADRQKLADAAIARWVELEPKAKILAVRIPSDRWSRDAMWRLENRTWYWIDRSKLQVQLIVQQDEQLAAIRPIDLYIDHVDGDKLSAIPFHDSVGSELAPHEILRVAKVR